MPLATVLVPTHDHCDTIGYAIASVQAQTMQDFEILVVGDGTPPRTDEIIGTLAAADPRIRYFPNPKGAAHGEAHRAAALAEATGEIVCYLGDDDLWLAHHLETMAGLLGAADFAHTNHVIVRHDGSLLVLAGDLNAASIRKRMGERKWNLFGPTCAGHTLAAYRRLPHGWRPRPAGIYSDLYMWRQWLDQPWCRFHSEPALTTLSLPSPLRPGWSVAQRVAELEVWWKRVQAPGFCDWLERERLLDWQRRCERPNFYLALANLLEGHEELAQAEELWRIALEIVPSNATALRRLSGALMKRNAREEALAMAAKAVEAAPTCAQTRHHQGNLLTAAGDHRGAAAAYARAIELDGGQALFHHHASRCLERIGRLEDATRHARRAIELEPERALFLNNLERLGASAP